MIRVFLFFIACFVAAWWLPMSDPVGIEFQEFVIKIQLWLILSGLLIAFFILLFLQKLVRFFTNMPARFHTMSEARQSRSRVRHRERILWEWMMARYDTLLDFSKKSNGLPDWSDHLITAVAALKEKSLLKFDEALIAMKSCGFTERLIQILRLYLLAAFSEQDVEQDMLSQLGDRDGSKIVWHWACQQSNLTHPEWFNARHQAKGCLSDADYEAMLPHLLNVALRSQNFISVYQSLTRRECANPAIIDQILSFTIPVDISFSTQILMKALKHDMAAILLSRVPQCVKDKVFIDWFLSYTSKTKDVQVLCCRAYCLLCLGDTTSCGKDVDKMSLLLTESATIDDRVVLVTQWLRAVQNGHKQIAEIFASLSHAKFASKDLTNI